MPCGCGSSTTIPSTCNKTAIVCNGSHVIINPGCSSPSLVTQPIFGTVTYSSITNTYVYTHTGLNLNPDSFTFTCGVSLCIVNITVQEGIEETQTLITLIAEGECEIGTPTYEWTIPPCASLATGYTIYNSTIQVIVNNYNPELPLESQICEFKVNVCCGSCINCCKCKTFYWIPPVCVGNCEEEQCFCPSPCQEYNPNTGNCENICVPEVINHCTAINKISHFVQDDSTYACKIQGQVNDLIPSGVFFGPPTALDNATGNINYSQLTNLLAGSTTITLGTNQILISNVILGGNYTFSAEELNYHALGVNYLQALNGYVFGFEIPTPCGVLKEFKRIVFSANYNSATTATAAFERVDFSTVTATNKTIKPKLLCCIETINKNCCAVEDCLTLTLTEISHEVDTTGVKIVLTPSLLGGTWSGSFNNSVASTCALVSDEQVIEDNGSSINIDINGVLTIYLKVTTALNIINTPLSVSFLYRVGGLTAVHFFQFIPGPIPIPSGPLNGHSQIVEGNTYQGFEYCYNNCRYINNYCLECCNDTQCVPITAVCINPPTCVNGECKCLIDGVYVEPLANGCCGECTAPVGCYECINGSLIAPTICAEGQILNENCECVCDCTAGYCIDRLEPNPALRCKPCPSGCSVVTGQWLFCGEPLQTISCPACQECISGNCTPVACSPTTYPNPLNSSPCCLPCPTCSTVEIYEYCPNFFYPVFKGCDNANEYYIFEWRALPDPFLLSTGCDYDSIVGATDYNVITSNGQVGLFYNTTGSVFFESTNTIDGFVLGSDLKIKKIQTDSTIPIQSLVLKAVYFGIETYYEFKFDVFSNSCALLQEGLITPENPRLFRVSCAQVLRLSPSCTFTNYLIETEEECSDYQVYNGKYLIFTNTGTDCEVSITGINEQNGVECLSVTETFSLTPCDGGCGCAPCPQNPIDTVILNIEQQVQGNIIAASSTVLINCGNTLSGLLSTCEPANGIEECGGGTPPNNSGASPVPITAPYTCNTCGVFNPAVVCNDNPEYLCGWGYQENALSVINWEGNNIQVSLNEGFSRGQLCYGINTECGYFCNCTIIEQGCLNNPLIEGTYNCETERYEVVITESICNDVLPGQITATNNLGNSLIISNFALTASGATFNVLSTSPYITINFTNCENCSASEIITNECDDCTINAFIQLNCELNQVVINVTNPGVWYYQFCFVLAGSSTCTYSIIAGMISTTTITIPVNAEEIKVKIIDPGNQSCFLELVQSVDCCVTPECEAVVNCNGQNQATSVSVFNINAACETLSAVVTLNTTTGVQTISAAIGTATGGDIILPFISVAQINSISLSICCNVTCCNTISLPVECTSIGHKKCTAAMKEPIVAIIAFDSSGSQSGAFNTQKTFAKQIVDDLFTTPGTKVGFIDFDRDVNTHLAWQNSNATQIKNAIDATSTVTPSQETNLDCPLFLANQMLNAYVGPNSTYIILITDGISTGARTCSQCYASLIGVSCAGFVQGPNGNGANIVTVPQVISVAYNSTYNAITHLQSISNAVFVANTQTLPQLGEVFVANLFVNPTSVCVNSILNTDPVTCMCQPTEEVFGYNCANCNELVLNGTYATSELCQLNCEESCIAEFGVSTINSQVNTPNKYQLVCQNNLPVCVQNNAAVNNFTTNSSCLGLTLSCGGTNGGEDCVYYEENTVSSPTLSYTAFNVIKEAINYTHITGSEVNTVITYSYVNGTGVIGSSTTRSFNEINLQSGVSITQAKQEIEVAFAEIANLFNCLFPKINLSFVNKNGGLATETVGVSATYGNIRIGTIDGSGFWANAGPAGSVNSYVWDGTTFSSNNVMRIIRLNINNCFRLNSTTPTSSCRSIMDNFIHEAGHALGLAHSQGSGNSTGCTAGTCLENTCYTGPSCCTPVTEVICGCGSSPCEQWTSWLDSPYYVKTVFTFYKPNSLDALIPVTTYVNNTICN